MIRKRTVSAQGADQKTLQEAYAEWGTTREKHLAKMQSLIERKNAEARRSLGAAPVVETVSVGRRVARPAAIGRGAAAIAAKRAVAYTVVRDPQTGTVRKVAACSPGMAKLVKQGRITLAELKDAPVRLVEGVEGESLVALQSDRIGKLASGARFRRKKGGGFK